MLLIQRKKPENLAAVGRIRNTFFKNVARKPRFGEQRVKWNGSDGYADLFGPSMASALAALADDGGPSGFDDPAEWQRQSRVERQLPGRAE